MPELPVFVDLLLVALLVATIVYAAMLNRRLAGLRQDRAGLDELVQGFAETTRQAFAGIADLKATAERSGRDLRAIADRADALREEIAFLVERGEKAADRLEAATTMRATRPAERAGPATAAAAPGRTAMPVAAVRAASLAEARTASIAPAANDRDRGALHRALVGLR